MAGNNTLVGGYSLMQRINYRVILVQVFVSLFLSINFLLITTFFRKHFFYKTMRYILFATTLLSDCLMLIVSNVLLILSFLALTIQTWLCLILYFLSSVYLFVTALTLTAMTLERYVAICMPLRHAELCTARSALHCILIIHGVSSIPCLVSLFIFFASAAHSFYTQDRICSSRIFCIHRWQDHLKSAICQFYFLIMCIIIVFAYVKIMKVAKSASGENKKSTWKALRTVILHAFQLLLGLIQLWCPFIESSVLKTNYSLFINVRYFNYITFFLAPRCLSPLIYGLRDDAFFLALKYYVFLWLVQEQIFRVFHLIN